MGTVIIIGLCLWGALWLYKIFWEPERQHNVYERNEYERKQALAAVRADMERERLHKELEKLRKTPTSSTGGIRGHRITRQIKMISVDNHHQQDDAELDFLRQVRACGGTGVINMKLRRQKGAFISIQGDAVVLE
jgi:hypothetical protein